MTNHTFDLAAALVDTAADRLANAEHGTTHILLHDFGQFPLTASHTVNDAGHTVRITAYDNTGVLAAAQASAPSPADTPTAGIDTFRAAHLQFTAIDPTDPAETAFLARGTHLYILSATAGTDQWRVSIGDSAPADFDDIAEALDHIINHLEHAYTA
jgi:hypothetical protein